MSKPWMAEVFHGFADQELGHITKLEQVKAGGELKPAEDKVTDLKISDYLVDVDVADSQKLNYAEALALAMKREKAAFKLYMNLAQVTDDQRLKDAFIALAQEEAKHKTLHGNRIRRKNPQRQLAQGLGPHIAGAQCLGSHSGGQRSVPEWVAVAPSEHPHKHQWPRPDSHNTIGDRAGVFRFQIAGNTRCPDKHLWPRPGVFKIALPCYIARLARTASPAQREAMRREPRIGFIPAGALLLWPRMARVTRNSRASPARRDSHAP